MSSPIKAVIFDVGGVLIRTRDQSGRAEWEERLGLPPGGCEATVLNSEVGYKAQRGEITTDALWQWVGEHLALGDGLETFRRDFWRGDYLDDSLVELIKSLRPNYQLAIISNANDTLLELLESHGLTSHFDLIVGSAYEGVMKPDREIYERTLRRLGRLPEEAVFIDDAPANVRAARDVGMRAILFTPDTDLQSELGALGVRVEPES